MFDPEMLTELLKVAADPERASLFAKRNTIGRTKVNGLIVSTVVTQDLGPETAILDKNGTHPVERYDDKISAERGHKMWVDKIRTERKVIKLAYPGFKGIMDDEEITLVPHEE